MGGLGMKLRSCEVCKRLFEAVGDEKEHPKCKLSYESAFKRVKEYLQEHPGTSLPILAEETGVDIPVIEQYLRQERIEVSPDSPVMLACNRCNAEISTGMYCDQCAKTLTGELKKIKNEIIATEKEEKGQLRYVQAKWRSK